MLHLLPASDLVNNLLSSLLFTIQNAANSLIMQAALKCLLYTVKFSNVHTNYLIRLRIVPILQNIIEKNSD